MHSYQVYERYRELQSYIGWTSDDAARVRRLGPIVKQRFPALVDDFYASIQRNPATAKIITGGAAQIARLKLTLVKWLEELFSGTYDQDYVLRRWKVGLRHVEIGLHQVYTNAAMSRLRAGLLDGLQLSQFENQNEALNSRASLNKLLDLDLAIIEEAYHTEYQRRQQQIERLATIGQVAGGIAHELRNPLNVIKTSVYFLRNARNLSAEKHATHLERIDRQATMADHVITALNSFAKLPVPELKPLEPAALVEEVMELTALPDTIRAEIDVPASLPRVLGDIQQLAIVLTNLIRNACDAMPEGGKLSITGCQVDASVEFEITDTGIGIPPDNLAKVMDPLFSTKARGIGLGLAISKAIIEKHGGDLTVRSKVGHGATFTVRLQAAPTGG